MTDAIRDCALPRFLFGLEGGNLGWWGKKKAERVAQPSNLSNYLDGD